MDTFKAVREVAAQAVKDAAQDNSNTLSPRDAPAVAEAVTQKLAPIIAHATNNEPWYQSRVTWGVLVAAVATMVKPIAGEFFDAQTTIEYADALASGGQLFGFGLTLYGRWKARKPLDLTPKG